MNGFGMTDDDIELPSLRTGVARQIRAAGERSKFRHRCVRFKQQVPAATGSRSDGHDKCTRVARSKLAATPGSDRPVEARLRNQRGEFRGCWLSRGNRGSGESDQEQGAGMFHGNSLVIRLTNHLQLRRYQAIDSREMSPDGNVEPCSPYFIGTIVARIESMTKPDAAFPGISRQ